MSRKPTVPGIDRRQQILDAALEIFAEQGFEAATNKAIAERAEVNQGLIYFYFASKADVYFATSAYYTAQVIAQLDAVFAQVDETDPADGFVRLLRGIVLILSVPPASHLLRIMYQVAGSHTPVGELSNIEERRAIAGLARHLTQRFRAYLEARVARKQFIAWDPMLVSYILTRTLIATVTMRGQGGTSQPDLDNLAETMAALYCYGFLPRSEQAHSK
jgi:TetR/AcrR family transcriptional regulator, acrEF/envCD operon repressor